MPTIFKLKYGEETRRSTFPELPSWDALSARLTTLYGIPTDKLAVSYTDLDGDDITLNTQEELRDYYETLGEAQLTQPVKLKVINLDFIREGATPRIRLNPDVDDDWHTLPPLQGMSEIYFGKRDVGPDSPHAFVEVIGSDAQSADWKLPEADHEEDKASSVSTVQAHSDKGKEKEALNFPSTVSLLEEESEVKQPIHVMSRSNDNAHNSFDRTSEHGQAPLKDEDNAPAPSVTNVTNDPNAEDPPLPTIDGPSAPSLTEDVALLLSTLSTAVASNPELTNMFRRIVHNTSSGTYWRAHRESLSQTVSGLSESMGTATEEFRRNAEAEAARNISQTLGHIFQSFSPVLPGSAGPDEPGRVPPADHDQSTTPPMPGSFRRPRGPWRHSHFRPFWGAHPPHPPPFAGPGHRPNGPPPPPPPFAGPGPCPPPPPPPFAGPGAFPNVPPPPPPFGGLGPFPNGPPPPPPFTGPGPFSFGPYPPPPPPPGVVGSALSEVPVTVQSEEPGSSPSYPAAPPKGPSRFTDTAGSSGEEPSSTNPDRIWDPSLRPSWLPAPPPIDSTRSTEWAKASPQELRASVEAAKEQYKSMKEQYRREREQRKKHKAERREGVGMTPIATTTPIPLSRETSEDNRLPASLERSSSQLVSNARGPFPRLEMVSIPRRSATLPGGGKRGSEDFVGRAVIRVTRRLADMGFSETSHPDLPEKIKAQIPHDKVLTKENEDDIVTTLLEGLLAVSPRATTPKTPVASGSGVRENLDVPGGWH